MLPFKRANILLPKDVDMTKWSVVACDQYTSEPEYWKEVEDSSRFFTINSKSNLTRIIFRRRKC